MEETLQNTIIALIEENKKLRLKVKTLQTDLLEARKDKKEIPKNVIEEQPLSKEDKQSELIKKNIEIVGHFIEDMFTSASRDEYVTASHIRKSLREWKRSQSDAIRSMKMKVHEVLDIIKEHYSYNASTDQQFFGLKDIDDEDISGAFNPINTLMLPV